MWYTAHHRTMEAYMSSIAADRRKIVDHIFPNGAPNLMCPLLTHYNDDGTLDYARIDAHIAHMRPSVPAFLAPGSTGDGWEMEQEETDTLVRYLIDEGRKHDFHLMIGVLRTEPGTVAPAIHRFLDEYTNGSIDINHLVDHRICGFTVTAPKGKDLSQHAIFEELVQIAEVGVPLAIYQLPQITENEIAPETFTALVSRYPNIYLMKDTSGNDRLALSGDVYPNVHMVRGAEGNYARWLRSNGGVYDGFLLSTANSFATELSEIITAIVDGGERAVVEAEELSHRVSSVVSAVFQRAGDLPFGNPFANANKALDHHFAWGDQGTAKEPPMTHSGKRLPRELVDYAGEQLRAYAFDVGRGYMN